MYRFLALRIQRMRDQRSEATYSACVTIRNDCTSPPSPPSVDLPEAVEVPDDVLTLAVVDDHALRHQAYVVEQFVRLVRPARFISAQSRTRGGAVSTIIRELGYVLV